MIIKLKKKLKKINLVTRYQYFNLFIYMVKMSIIHYNIMHLP